MRGYHQARRNAVEQAAELASATAFDGETRLACGHTQVEHEAGEGGQSCAVLASAIPDTIGTHGGRRFP